MRKLFQRLKECLQKGDDVVLVTIIANPDSVPPGAKARMLVNGEGSLYGAIDKDFVEHKIKDSASYVLKNKSSKMKRFRLSPQQSKKLDFVSGGNAAVYFQFISASDWKALAIVEGALMIFEHDEDSWLVTGIIEGTPWKMGVYSKSKTVTGLELTAHEQRDLFKDHCVHINIGRKGYYSEPLGRMRERVT